MALARRKRNELLTQQKDCCKLCGYHFGRVFQSCYDETTNTLVCHLCLMLLNSLRKSVEKGIELTKVIDYDMNNRIPA